MENTEIPKFYLYYFVERMGWHSNNAREVPRLNPDQAIIYTLRSFVALLRLPRKIPR
jgi:hypothetical protein